MANINAPFGLQPVFTRDGSPWNGATRRYYIPSTDPNAYYVGSPVISAAAADANGVPAVIVAVAGSTLRGVIVGVEPGATPEAASLAGGPMGAEVIAIPATKTRAYYVYVCDDPNTVFEIQGDLTATNQVAANANKNAQLTIAAPSPVTMPMSATVINSGTINTTQAHNIKLLGLSQRRPAPEFGAFAVWYCCINQHELMGNTLGI